MEIPQTETAVEIKPAKIAALPQTTTHAVKRPRPKGWFSFSANGMRAAVVKSIQDSVELPDGWKQALKSDIQSLDAPINFISVDCHRHEDKGKAVVHICISGSMVVVG